MEMERHDLTILDCTLRDGGYYTNWVFDDGSVKKYLMACVEVGINIVEIGYVRFTENRFGPYGDLPLSPITQFGLNLPAAHGLRFAVMIDAADFLSLKPGEVGRLVSEKLGDSIFQISIVRIAIRYDEVESSKLRRAVASLRTFGYEVCVNLMQIDLASEDELATCVAAVDALGPLSAVYIADSLGSMTTRRARHLIDDFRKNQNAPVGFHAHDNQGLALRNSLESISAGASWVDVTVNGMGRGAGNTCTEHLLTAMETSPAGLRPLMELVVEHFHPLKTRYMWGPSGPYGLAGMNRVHPTYVQHIEASRELSFAEKGRALDFVVASASSTFSSTLLRRAFELAKSGVDIPDSRLAATVES